MPRASTASESGSTESTPCTTRQAATSAPEQPSHMGVRALHVVVIDPVSSIPTVLATTSCLTRATALLPKPRAQVRFLPGALACPSRTRPRRRTNSDGAAAPRRVLESAGVRLKRRRLGATGARARRNVSARRHRDLSEVRVAVRASSGGGQLEVERRTLALGALEADPSAVCLDNLAGERQPESGASDVAHLG